MDEVKVKAIKKWMMPNNVKVLRSFLGLTNYYKRFIKRFLQIAAPLTNLMRNDEAWNWAINCEEAFSKLKEVI